MGKESIFYHFSENKWVETKRPTHQDILLKIDRNNKTIYFYEGKHSTPQQQMMAKISLNAMKITYPTYKFRQITETRSELMQNTFNIAFQNSEVVIQEKERAEIQLKWLLGILGTVEICFLAILGSLIIFSLDSELITAFQMDTLSSLTISIDIFELTKIFSIYAFFGLGCSILLIIHVIFAIEAHKYIHSLGIVISVGSLMGLILFWDLEISPLFEMLIGNNVIISGGKYWTIIITSLIIIGTVFILVFLASVIPNRSSKNYPHSQASNLSEDRKEK